MPALVIRLLEAGQEGSCGMCAAPASFARGPQLFHLPDLTPVCRSCGQLHAPKLSALLQLAQVAERVGQISSHRRQWVPMEALLDLSRASESYFTSALPEKRPA